MESDIALSPEDLDDLFTAVTRAFRSEADASSLLRRLGYPPDRAPSFRVNPRDAWAAVFADLDRGIIDAPYRRLLAAALRAYVGNPVFRDLTDRYVIPPSASAAVCHVIASAHSEQERRDAETQLRQLGLRPIETWTTARAVSYAVDTDDADRLRTRLDGTGLRWTVVPAGAPEYVYSSIVVEGPDGRRFQITDAPGQQTLGDLVDDLVAEQYPAEDSVLPTAIAGQERLDSGTTLLDAGIRDGDELRVSYQSTAGAGTRGLLVTTGAGRITVRVRAMMNPTVGRTSWVLVLVSRDSLGGVGDSTDIGTEFLADTGRTLSVEVLPRVNLDVVATPVVEIAVPGPGEVTALRFDVAGTATGPGELWVSAQQDQVPLGSLVLSPTVVDEVASQPAGTVTQDVVPVSSPAPPPLKKLEVYERRAGEYLFYDFALHVEDGDLRIYRRFSSPREVHDRDGSYVRGLIDKIEASGTAAADDPARFAEELRGYGDELLDELVPVELQRLLWRHRDRLRGLMVVSTEPHVPWELLHLKDPDATAVSTDSCFLAELGMVRWRWGALPPLQIRVRPGRVRLVAPDYPGDLRLPAAATERSFLRAELAAETTPATHADLVALLQSREFDLLHFVGHADSPAGNVGDAHLLLQGTLRKGAYEEEPLRVAVVGRNFRPPADTDGPLVFLNACRAGRLGHRITSIGGFAEVFVKGGAGAFVSTLWSVADATSADFAVAFYGALLRGGTMADAVAVARTAAREAGDPGWLAYTVYAHPAAHLEQLPED